MASLHFSVRLISCCKKWKPAHIALDVRIREMLFSQTFFSVQARTFLCNFLTLRKHQAFWLRDNENVGKFPLPKKSNRAVHFPLESRRWIRQPCAGMFGDAGFIPWYAGPGEWEEWDDTAVEGAEMEDKHKSCVLRNDYFGLFLMTAAYVEGAITPRPRKWRGEEGGVEEHQKWQPASHILWLQLPPPPPLVTYFKSRYTTFEEDMLLLFLLKSRILPVSMELFLTLRTPCDLTASNNITMWRNIAINQIQCTSLSCPSMWNLREKPNSGSIVVEKESENPNVKNLKPNTQRIIFFSSTPHNISNVSLLFWSHKHTCSFLTSPEVCQSIQEIKEENLSPHQARRTLTQQTFPALNQYFTKSPVQRAFTKQ